MQTDRRSCDAGSIQCAQARMPAVAMVQWPMAYLVLSVLCAFGCQLFDAGLSFAVGLAVSRHSSVGTDGVELTIWPWWFRESIASPRRP